MTVNLTCTIQERHKTDAGNYIISAFECNLPLGEWPESIEVDEETYDLNELSLGADHWYIARSSQHAVVITNNW